MVNSKEVEKAAESARINLEKQQIEQFTQEFDKILEKFNKLEEINTENTEPAFHPIKVDPEVREDKEKETLNREEISKNTENMEKGMFKGPNA